MIGAEERRSTRLTDAQMEVVANAIADATTPIDALVAALVETFKALGAGDLRDPDCPVINGTEWILADSQWQAICQLLIERGRDLSGPNESVNLGLDWMNKGPSGGAE